MRYLKNYQNFYKMFESDDSISSMKEFEDLAKSKNIDLKDESVLKAMAMNLTNQYNSNMNNSSFKPDWNEMARAATKAEDPGKAPSSATPMAARPRQSSESGAEGRKPVSESKLFEGAHGGSADWLHLAIEILEQLENIEAVKKARDYYKEHEHEKEEGGESVDSAFKIILQSVSKGLNGIINIVKKILKGALWLVGLIESTVKWVMRNILKLGHKNTLGSTKMVLGSITVALLIQFTLPALGAAPTVSGMSSLFLTIGFKFATAASVLRSLYNIISSLFLVKGASMGNMTTVVEFIDTMEKYTKQEYGNRIPLTGHEDHFLEFLLLDLSQHKDDAQKISDKLEAMKDGDKIKEDEVEKVPFLKTLLLRGKKGKSFFARTKEMSHEEMDEFKVWCGVKKDFQHKNH